jgi:hypothetical protein
MLVARVQPLLPEEQGGAVQAEFMLADQGEEVCGVCPAACAADIHIQTGYI